MQTIKVFTAFSGYDSQLYKMAGNSIVVSCLDLIFENLFFPQKREGELF